ncbi:MAG: alanine racemase [Candidatus Infernicultor aquiphilus]|uniref:Alanine racemase n=1 Tax=Candidatus Infernicultor aquiphilus TaxID=1805029 RepID=A0A2M7PNP4_9BACT|nr:MAG: alanine racemase [Candidatus Atribacteria bacterium CG_4_10_14_3_um_filter_34_13]
MQKLLGLTWTEVNLDAIAQNVKNIKKLIGKKKELMAVVKGNAYGHDILEISSVVLENGATRLAVARLEEAIFLRKAGITVPILVLGLTLKPQAESLVSYDITPTVCEFEMIEKLSESAVQMNKMTKIHLKVDTGMGRIGIFPDDVLKFIKRIKTLKNVEIEGIFTHFSVADEKDKFYTEEQFKKFIEILTILEKEGIKIPIKHVGNSATLLDLPHMWLDMVRPGLAIYGLYPSKEVKKTINLIPAQQFKTKIVFIKELPRGESISYGRTYITKRRMRVASLPVGYADGYNRLLSNQGEVLVRGQRVPIIGRVCMDQCMIDVTNLTQVEIGDEVVLWGRQGEGMITVEEIAQKIRTINYEIVHLPDKKRVAKLFIKDGKPWKIKTMLGERLL